MRTKMQREFRKYHKDNLHIYDAYKLYADELHNAGVSKKSISMITERIRWQTATRGTGDFKIQNDYRAAYARLLMWRNWYLRGSFYLKHSKIDGLEIIDLQDLSTWDEIYWGSV